MNRKNQPYAVASHVARAARATARCLSRRARLMQTCRVNQPRRQITAAQTKNEKKGWLILNFKQYFHLHVDVNGRRGDVLLQADVIVDQPARRRFCDYAGRWCRFASDDHI